MKMKKGLLSLLAVALTIVSCQDYDDQFAELTGLVNTLSTKVAGIETTTANLAALSATVNGLATAIAAIPTTDSTADLTAVLEGLTTAQADIDKIELILAGGVASEDDLAEIDALIDTLQEGVNTLLTNNQSINVNISIVDSETLATAQGYIEVGSTVSGTVDTTPAGYLLGGNLLVDHDGLSDAEIKIANAMTKKLISVSGTVSVTGAVDLSGLSYIALNYTKNGILSPKDSSITSLGKDLSIDGRIKVVSYPNLNSVLGDVSISNQASVTSINFATVTTVGATSAIAALNVASATSVNTGGFIATSVTANSATSVVLGQKTAAGLTVNAAKASSVTAPNITAVGALSVGAAKATSIDFPALKTSTSIAISAANSLTVVEFDKLTTGTIAVATEVLEFHIPKYVTAAGAIAIKARTINAAALKTINAAVTFASGSVLGNAVTSIGAAGAYTLTAGSNGIQNLSFPNAVVHATGTISAAASSVTIASTGDGTLVTVLGGVNSSLTLTAQEVAVVGLASGNSESLTSLSVTGSMTTLGVPVVGTFTFNAAMNAKFDALKRLTVGNFENFYLAETTVNTLTTVGKLSLLSIDHRAAADVLYTVNVGHGPNTYEDAPAQNVIVRGNSVLKSIDLGTVTKLMEVSIGDTDATANPALATILAPDASLLAANAAVNIKILANALVATASLAEPGTSFAEVKSPSLTTWKTFIGQLVARGIATVSTLGGAYTPAGGSIAHTIDFNKTGAVATPDASPQVIGAAAIAAATNHNFVTTFTASGTISTPNDLSLIDSND